MMRDFGDRGLDARRRIPGPEIGAIEPASVRRGVQERGHDDRGIGAAIDPFVRRQACQPLGDETIVGPAGKIHHRLEVGGARNGIEQPDGRKL